MSGQGFGKSAKSKHPRTKKYEFTYHSSDGHLNLVKIESASREEAIQEFNRFVRDLEIALNLVANQPILPSIEGES
jgi:hypothetical protein